LWNRKAANAQEVLGPGASKTANPVNLRAKHGFSRLEQSRRGGA
jgi:hypothetical protein